MLIPTHFEKLALSDIDSVSVGVENFIDARFERMLLINEFHISILNQR